MSDLLKSISELDVHDNLNASFLRGAGAKDPCVQELLISSIETHKQVRTVFSENSIERLGKSIKEHGLLNPITVYSDNGRYYVICGERRFRACRQIGLNTVKAIVVDKPQNETELIALQIIENLHRTNPPAIDIVNALGRLRQGGAKVEKICQMISVKESYVYLMLKISNELDDLEKQSFKELNMNFLKRYLSLKIKNRDYSKSVMDRVNEVLSQFNPGEDREEDEIRQLKQVEANKILNSAIKRLNRKLAAKSSAGKTSSNAVFGKKITVNWSRIDEILPNTKDLVQDYVMKTNSELDTVIAQALSEYVMKYGNTSC